MTNHLPTAGTTGPARTPGHRRLVTGGAAAVSALMLVTGWSSAASAAPSAREHAAKAKPVTITFMEAMSSGTQKPALAHLVGEFEKANPGVTVNLEVEPSYGVLQEKEEASVAAGDPPTIGQAYENWAASFAASKAIVPLTSYISGKDGVTKATEDAFWAGVWKDQFLPDGKVWMWPFNKSDYVAYYNATMLKKAGIAMPTTWAAYAKAAKALTKGPDWAESIDTGTSTAPENGTYLYLVLVKAFGGTWTKGGEPTFDTAAGVKAMTYLQDLVKEGAVKIGTDYPGQTALDAGRAAFDLSTVASYPYNVEGIGKKFQMQVAALPSGPAGAANAMEGTNIVVFAHNSPAQQLAGWELMKWLAEPAQTAYWAEQTGYLPVTRDALALMKSYDATHAYQEIAAESLQYAQGTPAYAWWTEAIGDVANAMDAVLVGHASPAQALATAQAEALKAAK